MLTGTHTNRRFLSSSVRCAVRQEVVKTVAGGGGQRGEYTGKPECFEKTPGNHHSQKSAWSTYLEFKKKSITPPWWELKPLPLAMATSSWDQKAEALTESTGSEHSCQKSSAEPSHQWCRYSMCSYIRIWTDTIQLTWGQTPDWPRTWFRHGCLWGLSLLHLPATPVSWFWGRRGETGTEKNKQKTVVYLRSTNGALS